MSVNEYDAVIVGGGIVGAVQALLLAQQGISTLLIEATQPETIAEPLQQRSVAPSHRSFEMLAARNLWPADVACPINEIHVTNSCLLYTSPSPRDATLSRMPSSA